MIKIYKNIRKKLKTGDLVLFSGKQITSTMIKLFTASKYSHVGMVLNLREYDYLTIWQSTNSNYNTKDLEFGKLRKGVQLVPLSAYVEKYNGEVCVRRLKKNGSLTITKKNGFSKDSIDKLMKLRRELSGKEYEKNIIELIKAAYDGPFGHNNEDLSSIFCSELVAEAYQSLGLLKEEDKPSNEYTPADFSESRMENLEDNFSLGKEIILKYS